MKLFYLKGGFRANPMNALCIGQSPQVNLVHNKIVYIQWSCQYLKIDS